MRAHDSHLAPRYHGSMTEPSARSDLLRQTRRWWLMPVVIGLVITAVVLLLGDFRPIIERFYSVF